MPKQRNAIMKEGWIDWPLRRVVGKI